MPLNFEKYRFTDGQTPLSAETFNSRFQDLDLRLGTVEALRVSWLDAVQQLSDFGLARIDAILSATVESLSQDEASAAVFVAEIQSQAGAAAAAVAALNAYIAAYKASVGALPVFPAAAGILAGDGNGGIGNVGLGSRLSFNGNVLNALPPLTWSARAASFTAAIDCGYYITVSGITAALPAGTADGQSIAILSGLPVENSFSLAPAPGQTIMGDASGLIVDAPYFGMTLVYFGALKDWRIF